MCVCVGGGCGVCDVGWCMCVWGDLLKKGFVRILLREIGIYCTCIEI